MSRTPIRPAMSRRAPTRSRSPRRPSRHQRRCDRHQPRSQHAVAKPAVDRDIRRLLCRHQIAALSAVAADLRYAGIVGVVRHDLQQFHLCRAGADDKPGLLFAADAVIGAAQALAQNLNSMTGSIQPLRTQAEQGIANDVQPANRPCSRSRRSTSSWRRVDDDSADATLEDQRDQAITQLSQLMNITVVQNTNNQVSIFTGTGLQLVSGTQASQLTFDNAGNAVGDLAVERQPEPGRRRHHHADVAGRQHHRSDRQRTLSSPAKSPPMCRCATDPAAGAKPARRNGQADVAGAVEPDDERHGGHARAASRDSASMPARCSRATPSSSPTPIR